MELYRDIPRLYTALAEWMACVLYIYLFPRRWGKGITVLLCAAALVIQAGFLIFTAGVPIYFWLPVMVIAVGMMYGWIGLCMKGSLALTGYNCGKAFLAAEFAAALEWQAESLIGNITGELAAGWSLLLLAGVYGIVFGVVLRAERKMQLYQYCHKITGKETLSVACIALLAFLFSNISFVVARSPLEGELLESIFYMRTLGDLCGLAALYAFQTKVCEYIIEKELAALKSMYRKQYDQYRYYQNSMEMIHVKYHDLKHQITGRRGEADEEKRKQWLDKLEQELDENRLIEQTGNQVLDTMLAAKIFQARKNQIRITCVADGKLLNFMHVTDICTIFGNGLDNAIESVITLENQTKRLIHVTLREQKNFILINIANYIEEEIKLGKGELPETSKQDKENHGYGLKSIRMTVEKYQGSMSVQAKNNWFELRILIPEKNKE